MRPRRCSPYHFLSEDEIKRIHAATLRVLEEVGVRVPDDRLLSLAESQGARVDRAGCMVRFPKRLVEEQLDANRAAYKAAGIECGFPKEEERTVVFTWGGQAIRAIDVETGEVRAATIRDMEHASRIASALEEVQDNDGLYKSSQVPPLTDDLYFYYTMVSHSTKPVSLDIMHVQSIPWLEEMATVVHGSKQAVQDKGVISFNAFASSPLQYPKDAIEKMWAVHDRGYKVSMGHPMTVVGGSGPVTLAGSAVSCNADAVAGMVLTRMIDHDAVARLGAAPVTLDMRTCSGLYADPMRFLLCAAFMDISRFYGIPSGGFHIGIDAAFPGIQAAAERMFTAMLTLTFWELNPVVRLGILGPSNASASLVQVFIDLEIGRLIGKFLQGMEVTDETLALDHILEAGVGGDFLAHEHTLDHFRRESWLPELFEHHMPSGRVPAADPVYEKARAQAKEVLQNSDPHPLAPQIQTQLETILKKAVQAING